jgi:DNA-binding CsgD family transcriptional regulator
MKSTHNASPGKNGKHDVTPREREVLQWLAEGMRSAEVAKRLDKPPQAVRAHVARLLQQLRAATPAEALARLDRLNEAADDHDDDGDDEQDGNQSTEALTGDGNTTEAALAERAF